MKTLEQFREFYRVDLLPRLEQVEVERKKVAAEVIRAGMIAAGLLVAGAVAGVALQLPQALLVFLFIGLVGYFMWRYVTLSRRYVANFKGSIIQQIITFADPGLTYDRSGYIPESVYWGSQLFLKEPDRYSGEDLVEGTVGKTAIRFSEIHSEYRTESRDSKGNRRTEWNTIFRGIFFVADFNKDFHGVTVVVPDIAERMFGRLGQMFQSWNIARTGDLVRLEDPEFEKRFVVYSTDQVEARYLLTPGLMARIMEYMDRTGSWAIHLSFVASNVHVAIPYQKDLFEPRLFKTVVDPDLAEGYLRDLTLVVSIVEELDLNTRIWSKQ